MGSPQKIKIKLDFNKTEFSSETVDGLTIINFNNVSNNFVYCTHLWLNQPKCFPAKYKDKKVISGNSINVFRLPCDLPIDFSFTKNYALLSNKKIAIICIYSKELYLTIFQYKDLSWFVLEYHTEKKKIHNIVIIDKKNVARIYTIKDTEKDLEKFVNELNEYIPMLENYEQSTMDKFIRKFPGLK